MQAVADLHMHSKYAAATSHTMDLDGLVDGAKVKGIDVLGSADFLHPIWQEELKQRLSDIGGIYEYKGIRFVLTGEISLIYTQGGRGRRVHHILMVPNFGTLDQVTEFFKKKGRVDYDGRPIFGFSSIELVEALMAISKDIEIIPAHAWTPWFSVFGSMSGFDSLKECFGEYVKHIHAIETGLSSDPPMNWRLSKLDDVVLVSNSDAHSTQPHRLGREVNVFDLKDVTYDAIVNAIRTRHGFAYTVEVDPNYGKYHYDGHRACNFSCPPEETRKLGGICPVCKRKLTIGVLNRVEQLADRPLGFKPRNAVEYKSLLPLMEVLAHSQGTSVASKKIAEQFGKISERFGSEFHVLLDVPEDELKRVVPEHVAAAILKNRSGNVKIVPGYDGVYGVPQFDGAPPRKVRQATKKTGASANGEGKQTGLQGFSK